MQHRGSALFLSVLFATLLWFNPSSVLAAANPIVTPKTPSTAPQIGGAPPSAYLQSVKILRENKYGENDLKSFVYQVFGLFDRHNDINQLLLLFGNEDLDMKVPEGKITSHDEFSKWYQSIGNRYQSNVHIVEQIQVSVPAKGDYRIDLTVQWHTMDTSGKYGVQRFRQQWRVIDGGGYWPRIVQYYVEPVF